MKTTISSILAAVSGFLMMIALAPPELQNQIPQLFPEAYRGRIAILLGLIAALAKIYQGHTSQDKLTHTPPQTTTTTETVSKETIATVPPTEPNP